MKDWTGNSKSAYTTLGASNHSNDEREANDYYATDPEALKTLLIEYLPPEDCTFTDWGARVYGVVNLNDLLQKILDAGIEILNVNSQQANIENYYLSLVGGMQNA